MNTHFLTLDKTICPFCRKKQRIKQLFFFLVLTIFLSFFYMEVYGQARPGGVTTDYAIEFWLRADYVHVPAERPKEGEKVPVWITVAGDVLKNTDSGKPSPNHWGTCPIDGNSSNGYYPVPTLSYDGMNFNEAVEFEGSTTQKLASMFSVPYTNSNSYYYFFVSELNTSKTSGRYAALFSYCSNSNGEGNNGLGWSGSGGAFWWNNGTSTKTQTTIGKSYGITSFIRTNSSDASLPMAVYHNGKKFEVGTGRTGTISGQHTFIGSNGLRGSTIPFRGKMQEVIMLTNTGNKMIDKLELDKIHTYLAIKYGQTMDASDMPNWYAANGAIVWEGSKNSGYTSGMFGLACDKGTNLFQKQGKSSDDEKLTVFIGNTLGRRNADNQNTLYAEGQNRVDSLTSYLTFGHNGLIEGNTGYSFPKKNYANGVTLTDEDINLRSRLIYKVQATYCQKNNTTPISASYKVSFQTSFAAQYMMVSSAPDFNPDNTRLYPLTNNMATDVEVKNGEYITFLVNEQGPGGVTTGMRMWLKADDTSTLTINTSNNEVNEWRNSGENNITYRYISDTSLKNSRPKYKTSDAGMNYHPALDFNPSTCATKYPFLSSTNAVFSTNVPKYYTIITAANVREFGESDGTAEITYFMGFGATTPGNGSTGDPNSRRPAMGIAKSGTSGVARFWSKESINGSKGLFNPGATSITLFEVGTESADRYLQFESDGFEERLAGTSNLASASYSQLAGSSMLGIASRKERQLDGTMSEVLAFEGKLSSTEKQQIYSYLGLKYGITLDLNKASATINYDYLLSDGTKIWPGTSNAQYQTYHHNVAGLVRDNTSGLNNKQARSTDTGAIVRIGIGNSLGEDGVLAGLSKNMESLMWGHNNGSGKTTLDTNSANNCGGLEERMNRIWMLDNTRTLTDYTLLMSVGGELAESVFPYNSANYQVYLIIAKSAADLNSNNPSNWMLIPGTYKDGEHYFNYTLPPNTNYLYFTFGAKVLPGACESCGFEGVKTLKFTKALWSNGTKSKKFTSLTEIAPTVTTSVANGAAFYTNNPRSYAGKTLRITRTGTSSGTMTTNIAMDKASAASFSIYEIDRRSSLYDQVTVYGLCGGNKVYPNLYYGGKPSSSSYVINGNKATANKKTSSALSSVGKMNVEFDEPVQSIVIEHVVTGAASGWKRIGLSPIEFTCPLPVYNVNVDGLAFRKGAPSEAYLCEEVQFVYKVYNADCKEKAVTFTDVLPAGMCWIENSLSIGEYNETHAGFNVTYNNDIAAGLSALTIDKLYVPGGGELTFFATARFVSEAEAEALGHSAPEAGEYSGNTSISYYSNILSEEVTLESCDMRNSDGCIPTTVNALESEILKPIETSITTSKNTYSEDDELTVSIKLKNENKSNISGTSLYIYFNEEFEYVDGSLTAGLTASTESGITGSFYISGINLIAESERTVEFKLKAPAKDALVPDGAGYVDLGLEYSAESGSDDICASCVFTRANGSLDIPYTEPTDIPVTGVTLNKTELTLLIDKDETLIATVAPEDATNQGVTWSSSDEGKVTVDQNGKVQAVAGGTAVISVTTADGGKTATCTVTVIVPVTSVSLDKTDLTLVEGEFYDLIATIEPETATDKTVTWISNDPSVVSVDANGRVGALKAGSAIITVTSNDGKKTATCNVTVSAKVIQVTGISLNKIELNLNVGKDETLIATVTPSNATNPAVTWKSSNPAVATVDNTGKVTAVKAGVVIITATADGKNATCTVTVLVPVTGVSLNKTDLALEAGKNETLIATVAPENATNKTVKWTSSNPAVATVDNVGKVIAVKAGTATITVMTEDGNFSANCTLTVSSAYVPVTEITLDKTTLQLEKDKTGTLTATVKPSNATNPTVTWTSSNTAVATVTNGVVTAVAGGTATITATADGKTATCEVTVSVPVTEVTLNKTTLTLVVGTYEDLEATITPTDATDKSLTWTSSDESVAYVDIAGKVVAQKGGKTTITVKTNNGKTATCVVTVTVPVTGVTLNKTSISLVEGTSETLLATIEPDDATIKSVTWKSDDTSVAEVNSAGLVTAKKEGTTTITVTTDDNKKTATCTVTVTKAKVPVDGISIIPTSLDLEVGDKSTISATISPTNATDQRINWASNNTAVATVDANGEVTAVSVGSATITATTVDQGKYAECVVVVNPKIVKVTGVELDKSFIGLFKDESYQLKATVNPTDATNKSVTWKSSKPSVATVDENGLVTAVAVGSATITVTTNDGGKTAVCDVTVSLQTIPVTKVELNKKELELIEDESETLTATITPSDATDKSIVWASSDPTVATVSATGEVTALKVGTTKITATNIASNKSDECALTVKAKEILPSGVTLNKTVLELKEGATDNTLIATVSPENATNKTVTWSSNATDIATVDNTGKITAIKAGTATITVTTSNGYFATCEVTVSPSNVPVTGVTLNISNTMVYVNSTVILTATVLPSNASNKSLIWKSSDESIATVNSDGIVTGHKEGTVEITVTTIDGDFSAVCSVIVTKTTKTVKYIFSNKHTTSKFIGIE